MFTCKQLTVSVLSVLVCLGGSSAAIAKGHDQGVADGTRTEINPGDWRGGIVAGRDSEGVGFDPKAEYGFRGVAADLDADLIYGRVYGRDIVSQQRSLDR